MENIDLSMMLRAGTAEGQGESPMKEPMAPSQGSRTDRAMAGVSASGLAELLRSGWNIEHPLTGGGVGYSNDMSLGVDHNTKREQGPTPGGEPSLAQMLNSAGAPGPEKPMPNGPTTPMTDTFGMSGQRDPYGMM